MREVSYLPPKNEDSEKLAKSFEQALIKAMREIKPPIVTTESPIIELKSDKERCAYRIEVNRDGHGRIDSLLVSPV